MCVKNCLKLVREHGALYIQNLVCSANNLDFKITTLISDVLKIETKLFIQLQEVVCDLLANGQVQVNIHKISL